MSLKKIKKRHTLLMMATSNFWWKETNKSNLDGFENGKWTDLDEKKGTNIF
jgi:hypothetical protein